MHNRLSAAAALLAAAIVTLPAPALADGEILLTHAKALAGNVTPGDPPGYPIVLTLPGSYQLASNLFTAANKIAIQVASDNVTIDLNGFTLQGSNVALFGIAGEVEGVTIRNGTITGFKFDGILGVGINWTVENMLVTGNGRNGVILAQEFGAVRGSTVTRNGADGIFCSTDCLVTDSNASENAGIGIVIASGLVLANVIIGNNNFGISGGNDTGFGNNMLQLNSGGAGTQVSGVIALQPNVCFPACP